MAQAKQRSSGSVERPSLDNFPTDLSGASKDDLLELSQRFGVDFIRLQFTDILGINKNVEVPRSQFAKALDGEIMFDGSSIEGFVRIEESDMLLKPDLAHLPDPAVRRRGRPGGPAAVRHLHAGRAAVRRLPADSRSSASSRARKKLGFAMMAGCEAEFFLFEKAPDGSPTTVTHDSASYFDLGPGGQGRGDPPRHRGAAGGDGVRGRGGAPRGGRRASTRSTSSTPTR